MIGTHGIYPPHSILLVMPILKLDELVNSKGQETRIKILQLLSEKPRSPYEIAKMLDLNYSTVRYHLDMLQKFGLVTSDKRRKILYRITKDGEKLLAASAVSRDPAAEDRRV